MPQQPPAPPKVATVEIIAAQPTEVDRTAFASTRAGPARSELRVSHVVKVKLKTKPPVTSLAWALYVGDERISKYWEYENGIYFTVVDPAFFARHKGQKLRFSQDGVEFFDTGMKLESPPAASDAVAPATKLGVVVTGAQGEEGYGYGSYYYARAPKRSKLTGRRKKETVT